MARTTATIAAIVLASTLAAAAPALTGEAQRNPDPGTGASTTPGAGEPLSEPSPFYSAEVHEEIVDATAAGMAYNPYLGARVNFTAGEFIQPGRPVFLKNGDACTAGFVLGSPGNYAITTAEHCLGNGKTVNMPLQANPARMVKIGKVADTPANPELEIKDWAIIEIDDRFQRHVDPGVLGLRVPASGAYEVPNDINASPVSDQAWPMPVLMISHHPADEGYEDVTVDLPQLVTTTQTPMLGWLVEEHDGTYLCECPVTPGDSGGPVVVFTPDHPRGAALGLVSTWAGDRIGDSDEYPWRLVKYLFPSPNTPVEDTEDNLEEDQGMHEIAAIMPMPEVLQNSTDYDQVATAPLTSTADPCPVYQAGSGGSVRDIVECYTWYWPDPSNPCAGYTVEECVNELVDPPITCETCPSDVSSPPSLPVDPPNVTIPSTPEAPG